MWRGGMMSVALRCSRTAFVLALVCVGWVHRVEGTCREENGGTVCACAKSRDVCASGTVRCPHDKPCDITCNGRTVCDGLDVYCPEYAPCRLTCSRCLNTRVHCPVDAFSKCTVVCNNCENVEFLPSPDAFNIYCMNADRGHRGCDEDTFRNGFGDAYLEPANACTTYPVITGDNRTVWTPNVAHPNAFCMDLPVQSGITCRDSCDSNAFWTCDSGRFRSDGHDHVECVVPANPVPGDCGGDATTYEVILAGAECASFDVPLGARLTIAACAARCHATAGCEFYTYFAADGECRWEQTASPACVEGFVNTTGAAFYTMKDAIPPCSGHGICTVDGCACNADAATGHWTGVYCDACAAGYASATCTTPCAGGACRPCGGRGVCSEGVGGDGTCRCGTAWAGPDCTECKPGYFGTDCRGTEDRPMCPTMAGGLVCNSRGTCNDGRSGDGTCTCDDGWALPGCEECDSGHWGPSCQGLCPGAPAAPCSNHGSCNATTGACECDAGWGGFVCETRCACGPHGTCVPAQPVCVCHEGWAAPDCDTCLPGRAGAACDVLCPGYPDDVCSGHGSCSPTTGTCVCDEGWFDESGNVTDPAPCVESCPLGSDGTVCSRHGLCNQTTLLCECDTRWAGGSCDECAEGYSGATCASACPVNPTTGEICSGRGLCVDAVCRCKDSCGAACEEVLTCPLLCPYPGQYGGACEKECDGFSRYSQSGLCNGHGVCSDGKEGDGVCACFDRSLWVGDQCDLQCPFAGNGFICGGDGAGVCNATDATCACTEKFTGADCGFACPVDVDDRVCSGRGDCVLNDTISSGAATVAPGVVAAVCVCGDNATFGGAACDVRCGCEAGRGVCGASGDCACEPQYAGRTCGECADGLHGEACDLPCVNGVSRNRLCLCNPSWSGADCDRDCPRDIAGRECNGRGVCRWGKDVTEADTQCACDEDWYGPGCEINCTPDLCASRFPYGSATCDRVTGACVCDAFHQGEDCAACSDGRWGVTCERRCPCVGGACDRVTGVCRCYDDDGNGHFTGTQCQYCAEGYTGEGCLERSHPLTYHGELQSEVVQTGVSGGLLFVSSGPADLAWVGGNPIALYDLPSQQPGGTFKLDVCGVTRMWELRERMFMVTTPCLVFPTPRIVRVGARPASADRGADFVSDGLPRCSADNDKPCLVHSLATRSPVVDTTWPAARGVGGDDASTSSPMVLLQADGSITALALDRWGLVVGALRVNAEALHANASFTAKTVTCIAAATLPPAERDAGAPAPPEGGEVCYICGVVSAAPGWGCAVLRSDVNDTAAVAARGDNQTASSPSPPTNTGGGGSAVPGVVLTGATPPDLRPDGFRTWGGSASRVVAVRGALATAAGDLVVALTHTAGQGSSLLMVGHAYQPGVSKPIHEASAHVPRTSVDEHASRVAYDALTHSVYTATCKRNDAGGAGAAASTSGGSAGGGGTGNGNNGNPTTPYTCTLKRVALAGGGSSSSRGGVTATARLPTIPMPVAVGAANTDSDPIDSILVDTRRRIVYVLPNVDERAVRVWVYSGFCPLVMTPAVAASTGGTTVTIEGTGFADVASGEGGPHCVVGDAPPDADAPTTGTPRNRTTPARVLSSTRVVCTLPEVAASCRKQMVDIALFDPVGAVGRYESQCRTPHPFYARPIVRAGRAVDDAASAVVAPRATDVYVRVHGVGMGTTATTTGNDDPPTIWAIGEGFEPVATLACRFNHTVPEDVVDVWPVAGTGGMNDSSINNDQEVVATATPGRIIDAVAAVFVNATHVQCPVPARVVPTTDCVVDVTLDGQHYSEGSLRVYPSGPPVGVVAVPAAPRVRSALPTFTLPAVDVYLIDAVGNRVPSAGTAGSASVALVGYAAAPRAPGNTAGTPRPYDTFFGRTTAKLANGYARFTGLGFARGIAGTVALSVGVGALRKGTVEVAVAAGEPAALVLLSEVWGIVGRDTRVPIAPYRGLQHSYVTTPFEEEGRLRVAAAVAQNVVDIDARGISETFRLGVVDALGSLLEADTESDTAAATAVGGQVQPPPVSVALRLEEVLVDTSGSVNGGTATMVTHPLKIPPPVAEVGDGGRSSGSGVNGTTSPPKDVDWIPVGSISTDAPTLEVPRAAVARALQRAVNRKSYRFVFFASNNRGVSTLPTAPMRLEPCSPDAHLGDGDACLPCTRGSWCDGTTMTAPPWRVEGGMDASWYAQYRFVDGAAAASGGGGGGDGPLCRPGTTGPACGGCTSASMSDGVQCLHCHAPAVDAGLFFTQLVVSAVGVGVLVHNAVPREGGSSGSSGGTAAPAARNPRHEVAVIALTFLQTLGALVRAPVMEATLRDVVVWAQYSSRVGLLTPPAGCWLAGLVPTRNVHAFHVLAWYVYLPVLAGVAAGVALLAHAVVRWRRDRDLRTGKIIEFSAMTGGYEGYGYGYGFCDMPEMDEPKAGRGGGGGGAHAAADVSAFQPLAPRNAVQTPTSRSAGGGGGGVSFAAPSFNCVETAAGGGGGEGVNNGRGGAMRVVSDDNVVARPLPLSLSFGGAFKVAWFALWFIETPDVLQSAFYLFSCVRYKSAEDSRPDEVRMKVDSEIECTTSKTALAGVAMGIVVVALAMTLHATFRWRRLMLYRDEESTSLPLSPSLSFLTAPFRTGCAAWWVVLWLRPVAVAAAVAFADTPHTVLAVYSAAHVCGLVATSVVKPFATQTQLETQLAVVAVVLAQLILQDLDTPHVALSAIIGGVLFAALGMVAFALRRASKRAAAAAQGGP